MFRQIKWVMSAFPDCQLPSRGELSCHLIARALATVFPVEFEDGYFGSRGWRHSWLVTPNEWVIDAYPVATIGGPILVDVGWNSPWKKLYLPSKLEGLDAPAFEKDRDFVIRVMRGVWKNTGGTRFHESPN